MENTNAVASEINKPLDPFATLSRVTAGRTAEERGAAARKAQADIMRGESEARRAELVGEAARQEQAFGAKKRVEEAYATGIERRGQEFEQAVSEYPQRKLTEFDSAAAAELAATTALIGGFAGMVSARSALRAMEGFTRGHKQGREDLYNQELKTYEAEVNKFKDKVNIARTIYENALKAEQAKRGAGMVEFERLREVLPGTLIDAKVRQKDFIGVGKSLEDMSKLADQIELAKIKATDKKRTDLPADLAKSFNTLAPNYERFNRLNESKDPKYFGVVPNETLARALMKLVEVDLTPQSTAYISEKFNVSRDQILWWKEYDQFVAKVRNELFGATLTKPEKENFDRTIITPSTEPETAKRFFETQVQIVNNAVAREVQKGLARQVDPDIISAYLGVDVSRLRPAAAPSGQRKAFATEEEADQAFARGEIKDGAQITVGGRNATYKANQ